MAQTPLFILRQRVVGLGMGAPPGLGSSSVGTPVENGLFERFLINWPPLPRPTTLRMLMPMLLPLQPRPSVHRRRRSDDRDATAPSYIIICTIIIICMIVYTYVRFWRGRRAVSEGETARIFHITNLVRYNIVCIILWLRVFPSKSIEFAILHRLCR